MRISDWSSDVCSSDLGPVAVDVELAERGVAVEHLERGLLVQALLELPGRAALDGVAARFAREQAGEGEGGQDDGHGQYAGDTGPQGSVPVGIRHPSFR